MAHVAELLSALWGSSYLDGSIGRVKVLAPPAASQQHCSCVTQKELAGGRGRGSGGLEPGCSAALALSAEPRRNEQRRKVA